MTFKAIIFDMDGLLVDSEVIWEEAETVVLDQYNIKVETHIRNQFIGLRNIDFMGRLQEVYQIPASPQTLNLQVVDQLLEFIPLKTHPMPGAREIVAWVHEQGIPTAIASSSPTNIIDAVAESQGWSEIIPVRVSADHVGVGKPNPAVYLEAARQLNVAPEDCLALEDSPNGARAAVAAGMTCYAVPDLSHTRVEAFEGITEHVFDSLHAVLKHLTT
jgi:HAD superfamily hydrolase (TIGR01509 family)